MRSPRGCRLAKAGPDEPGRGGSVDSVGEGIIFDRYGRMQYHPDFHPNHGVKMTEEELEYLCKFCEVDDWRTMAFALGRTEHTLRTKVNDLKKDGRFEYYKNLSKHW